MTSTETRAAQIAALKDLRECDHCFISKDGVREITAPFGFMGSTFVATSTLSLANPKGLLLAPGVDECDGQDAAVTAEEICDHLGVEYPPMFGRGSRLRVAVAAALKHLGADNE